MEGHSYRRTKKFGTYDELFDVLAEFKTAGPKRRIALMPELGYFALYVVNAADALVGAMHDADSRVRAAAAMQLGWVRWAMPKSLPCLIAALKDTELGVREQ